MYEFCQEYGIAHERCGKLVVATEAANCRRWMSSNDEARPIVWKAYAGWGRKRSASMSRTPWHRWAIGPETGIIDYKQVSQVYADIIRKEGGEIQTKAQVHGCRRYPDELVLETSRGAVHCRYLVNCGGLHADEVARICGADPQLQIVPSEVSTTNSCPSGNSW